MEFGMPSQFVLDVVQLMKLRKTHANSQVDFYSLLGCITSASLGVLLLDSFIFYFNVYYYSDDINVLYPIALDDFMRGNPVRPFENLILLICNTIYLPLWLVASLFCTVGATVLSGLACERLFERRLPKAGWWLLGVANPLLFYAVTQPDVVSQGLANLLFAGAMLALVAEAYRLSNQPLRGWHGDKVAVFLNLLSAALFFTKETAVAAATVIPATAALMRYRAGRLSPLFLCSLLVPIAAASGWVVLKLKFPYMLPHELGGTGYGRYGLKLDPGVWVQHFAVTLAFPITPLPTSFVEFEPLRRIWVVVAFGFVMLFTVILVRAYQRRPIILSPLLVIGVSCIPMVLMHSSELYSSMIAPFAVAILLLFGIPKMRRLAVTYGLLLYAASFANATIYSLSADFNLFGLRHLSYSIYGKGYQFYPMCPIATTAHVAWDGAAETPVPFHLGLKGRIICIGTGS
jgi:hypothetical protein